MEEKVRPWVKVSDEEVQKEVESITMRARYEQQFREEQSEKRFMFWTTYVWFIIAPLLLIFYAFYTNQ